MHSIQEYIELYSSIVIYAHLYKERLNTESCSDVGWSTEWEMCNESTSTLSVSM